MQWRRPGWWIAAAGLACVLAVAAVAWRAPAAALNLLSSVASRRVAEGQAYGPLPRQRFDLYRPSGTAPTSGWPLVVFFYGGAWNRGERAGYRFVGEALASRGIVAVVADYRLYPQARYPEFLRDGALALAHARRHIADWQVDGARVFVMGHSAGAYNAGMLALDGRWLAEQGLGGDALAGWIGLAGPYDFLPIRTLEVQPVFGHPNVPADSQPMVHATGSRRPALLVAALHDEIVNPLRNTRQMATRLAAGGATVTLREYPALDHMTLVGALAWPLQSLAPVLDDVTAFVAATR